MAKEKLGYRQMGFRADEAMWKMAEEIQKRIYDQLHIRPSLADIFREALTRGLQAKLSSLPPLRETD